MKVHTYLSQLRKCFKIALKGQLMLTMKINTVFTLTV